ncbi:phage major capsid protein [Paraburkholderia sprentiae WSM5005]|uniref:Phage major capsid protein n=1 Tax=Paraburkholderia sprentiae WSM5005 TaxID=754502 RepID=A0A1L1P6R0_9BURK|nr:phage major capsid protein [Paraburkholderia sprentiae]APA88513.1 phage major capsid protein [Paraburkholderia sprentiae WSM5005]
MIAGNSFVKFIRCMAKANGDPLQAAELCRKDYSDGAALSLCQKAIISTGDLGGDAAWRASMAEFMAGVATYDLLPRVGAVSPLHIIPLRTRVLVQDEDPVAIWTGEGEPVVVSGASFTETKVEPQKAAGLIVVTKEVVALASDAAETALTRSLQRAVARITSAAAFAAAPVAGAPASLLVDATEVPSTGDVKADMAALTAAFKGDIERAVLVMSSNTALSLCLQPSLVGSAGGLGVKGGVFCGLPVVASSAVADDVVALVDAGGVTYGDDGVELDVATQADVTIDGVMHSLWAENLVGYLARRFVAWQAAPGSIAYLSDAAWATTAAATKRKGHTS